MPYIVAMEWYRTDEQLPEDGSEVIIRVRGDYYLAQFVEVDSIFRLKDGGGIPVKDVMWTEIVPP